MADSTIRVVLPPKLTGADNYSNWSTRLKFHLMAQDLWDVVTGDLRPEQTAPKVENLKQGAGSTGSVISPTNVNLSGSQQSVSYIPLTSFRRKDQQAMAIIVGRLSDLVFPVVQHLTEDTNRRWAKAAWDALAGTYAKRGFNYKSQQIIELANLTSEGFNDVQAYANHHLDLCQRIIELGGLTLDDFSPAVFLNGLGSQYSHWVTGARSRARRDGSPKVPDLLAELVDEERLINRPEDQSLSVNWRH